jgi:hypothetical protein
VTLSINIYLLQLRLQFGWNGVHFCRRLPLNETSPATAQVLAEASDESRPLRWKVLHKGILVVVVHVRLWWRRGILPEELPTVRQRVGLQSLRGRRRLGAQVGGGWRRLVEHHVRWVNAVAVLLAFPQFAADKTDSNHSAVAAHHFIFGAPC